MMDDRAAVRNCGGRGLDDDWGVDSVDYWSVDCVDDWGVDGMDDWGGMHYGHGGLDHDWGNHSSVVDDLAALGDGGLSAHQWNSGVHYGSGVDSGHDRGLVCQEEARGRSGASQESGEDNLKFTNNCKYKQEQ
ncbi:hypothetical protein RR46_07348 [Papilio xuthus]|uniref:Uncharacterized protein n=1 Tax=Papilio xuthus TaxID=66420 RepID=A0A194PW46_PAPXU|nr:hypothetical protein RR46_07348 [Papilio xuthus]